MSKTRDDESNAMPEDNKDNADILSEIEKECEKLKKTFGTAKSLAKEARQALVAYMRRKGLSMSEIAAMLGMSKKTVQRDMEKIKAQANLPSVQEVLHEIMHELLVQWQSSKAKIERAQAAKELTVTEVIDSEMATWTITEILFRLLERFGFIPWKWNGEAGPAS